MAQKDPAFLFYSKDWLQGTAKLFLAEKGAYVDLLAHQHQDGFLPKDIRRLAKIVGVSEQEFLPIWDVIKDKFVEKDGKIYNEKLISVVSERSEHSEMRTVVGTFGQFIKTVTCSDEKKEQIRKKFDYKDFLGLDKATLSKCLTKFIDIAIANGEARYGDADAIADASINTDHKGGAGGIYGKQEKITDDGLWTTEKNSFLNHGGWIFKFCSEKSIKSELFDSMAAEFIADIELKEDFKTAKELRSHFTNWFNLKKKINGKHSIQAEQSSGDLRQQVADEHRKRSAARQQSGS